MQRPWLCHPPCLPSGRLRRLSRHRRRLAAENSEGPLGAPTGGLARPQGESRLTPAEPENAASVPVGTPSGVVSPLYTDTMYAQYQWNVPTEVLALVPEMELTQMLTSRPLSS